MTGNTINFGSCVDFGGISFAGLSIGGGQSSGGGVAFGYADGITFQLDCRRGVTASEWRDLVGKVACTASAPLLVDDGVVFDGSQAITLPAMTGVKVEICRRAEGSDDIETITLDAMPGTIGSGFVGVIYSIRAYPIDAYTAEVAAHNIAIDTNRFAYPASALWLGSSDTLMLGTDFLCIE